MNLAPAGWYSNKKGFLLVEALISVLVVSIMVLFVSAAVRNDSLLKMNIREKRDEMNQYAEEKLREIPVCTKCAETVELQ